MHPNFHSIIFPSHKGGYLCFVWLYAGLGCFAKFAFCWVPVLAEATLAEIDSDFIFVIGNGTGDDGKTGMGNGRTDTAPWMGRGRCFNLSLSLCLRIAGITSREW